MQKYEHNILKNIDLSIFIKNFFRLFFGLSNLTFVSISKSVLSGSFTAESLNEGLDALDVRRRLARLGLGADQFQQHIAGEAPRLGDLLRRAADEAGQALAGRRNGFELVLEHELDDAEHLGGR